MKNLSQFRISEEKIEFSTIFEVLKLFLVELDVYLKFYIRTNH